jgi:hypothetical protein
VSGEGILRRAVLALLAFLVAIAIAMLTSEDRAAIAAYLKSLPPRANAVPKAKRDGGE